MNLRPEDHQQLGRMVGQILNLEKDQDDIKSELREINKSLQEIKNYIAENRGGWKLLLGLVTLTATVSSIITYVVGWLKP